MVAVKAVAWEEAVAVAARAAAAQVVAWTAAVMVVAMAVEATVAVKVAP